MPVYEYLAQKDKIKSVSVVVSADNDDQAETLLQDFLLNLGLKREWDHYLHLNEVEEDDFEEEDADEECEACGHLREDHGSEGESEDMPCFKCSCADFDEAE